jgi:hypothetical protein
MGAEKRMRLSLWAAGACLCVLALAGCEGLLDVDDSGIIVPGDLDAAGPAAIPTLVNGMVGDYHEAVDDIIRYAALLTDEMILAGTFPTRLEVDRRRIQPNNGNLTVEMYVPLHRARMMADTTFLLLEERLGDPVFESVGPELREGMALGRLYGGYARLWLAELYCWSILTGVYPEPHPLLPDERVAQAIGFLEEAEALAAEGGWEDVRLAAIVGQARAHLWLGQFVEAEALASQVPRSFVYWAEYSNNDPDQYNEMYVFTWGDTEAIRWTVGDGTSPARGGERWPYLDEFLALNLVRDRPPGFTASFASVPVMLQMRYNRPESNVLMASGVEAALIRAETAVRSGQAAVAEGLLNQLRADFSFRANVQWGVELPAPGDALQPLTLSGDPTSDLGVVVAERARELWLTGDRHVTSRRLRRDPAVEIDLFPPVKGAIGGGDDIAFPMVQRELDNNPHLSGLDACPPGQEAGGWR